MPRDEPDDEPEEPCFLTPEDDPAMLDPPMEHPVGPRWWEGRWPHAGISSLADLELWVDQRLEEAIWMRWSSPNSMDGIALDIGRQTVENATRYLARIGSGNHPSRPKEDLLRDFADVQDALEALLRHIKQERMTTTGASNESPARTSLEASGTAMGGLEKRPGMARGKRGPPQRSWTQPELDNAIREYKAKRSSSYPDLVEAVGAGKPGAIAAARKTYGRNAIAKALGVKSAAMVSKSPAWREIADQLRLVPADKQVNRSHRIGLDVALEKKAEDEFDEVPSKVIRLETESLIEKALPRQEAEAIMNRLQLGQTTDEEVRILVELYREQRADARNPRAY